MDYNKTLDYINSFINFEKIPRYNYASSFNLDRMHAFLQELGNPHQGLSIIHVAGSKGKGSTCAITASFLRQAGYCIGLYTSPHLLDVRERVRVLDYELRITNHPSTSLGTGESRKFEDSIEKEEFIELIERIKPAAEKFRDHKELDKLSFFEILTACAFLYFKEKQVDYAILETGLGGRLDATNVIDPLVCGITNISLEHIDKLGSSLELIAREKTGIIKKKGLIFTASQQKEVMDVIKSVCRDKEARLYEIDKDITYSIIDSNENFQIFNLDGPDYSYKNLQLNLLGRHQVENATLAIAMVKSMDKNRLKIDEEVIHASLKNIFWPGRLQIVQREPYIILDGAQNVASIEALLSSIKVLFHYKRLICIFGISSDKDIEGVSRELDKLSNIVILTKSRSERAKDPFYLKENFFRSSIKMSNNAEEALGLGLKIAGREDLILVTGSLYIVGDAMKFLEKSRSYIEA